MKFSPLLWPTTSTAAPDAVDEAGAAASCYFANGGLAEGYRACDAQSPVSSCCPTGYTCSGNALCVLTAPSSLEQPELLPETVSRGACTEPLWNGRYCGGKCLGKTARPPPCCTTLPPVSTQHRCPPRCGGVRSERTVPVSNVQCHPDSEDATGGAADCDPVGDGGRERDCCAGGNAKGGCVCSSNVAEAVTLGEAGEAQTILGRRAAAPYPETTADSVRAKQARLHDASKTASQGVIATEAGSSEMLPGHYSSWVRTSSSTASIPAITPVTLPTWSGAWSESVTTLQPETTTTPSTLSTERPITISVIASTLTHSSSSSSSRASISPSVPTVIPVFPDGASAQDNSSNEAATSSLATKLGLGLGIPLVVLVVALLTAFIYRRQRRLQYAQAPPFDFSAPEMAPVSAADFTPGANYRDHFPPPSRDTQQQQRAFTTWSEWGTGAWTGTRAAAWGGGGGGGSLDDNQVGFIDHSIGHQGYYYNGSRDAPPVSPTRPPPAPGYSDLGSPYEDRGHDTFQVPVVQVHQPQWVPPPAAARDDASSLGQSQGQGQGQGRGWLGGQPAPAQQQQRDLARVGSSSRGRLSVNEEVSPLSSTGSGMMPYPRTRVSAISGMGGGGGGDANPRVSRG